ncbi:MAG: hypothetical protein JSV86_17125 [Gemmatimonadota bacterium]|nr:MAG: hypothetical protein JSV86_17125 [Gemmatimonadota bacterium]
MIVLAQAAAPHVTSVERGTGEIVECRYNGFATCAGQNTSGKRLLNRVVAASQTFTHAARRLIGTSWQRRAPDGTLQTVDLEPISAALRKLPVKLFIDASGNQRTILFVFLHDNPKAAVPIVAADPYGFIDLLDDVRRGRYGAGDLIDAPFPTAAVVGTLAAVGVVGAAAWLARR